MYWWKIHSIGQGDVSATPKPPRWQVKGWMRPQNAGFRSVIYCCLHVHPHRPLPQSCPGTKGRGNAEENLKLGLK